MFISLRGWPDAGADEPQHEAMGMATHRILSDCGVPYWLLKDDEIQLQEILKKVDAIHKKGSPAAVLVPGGVLAPAAARSQGQPGTDGWGRRQAIQALLPHLEGCAIFSTTGYISRDLFAAADRELNFYMQGSMGHALALGLGVAISQPQRRVVVLDGDGAVLMHMGTTATVGAIAPENLVHVVIDNGVYESTGGQPTMARSLCWTCLGSAARYRSTKQVSSAGETDSAMPAIMAVPGPHLIVVTVDIGGKVPPRATAAISPEFFHARIRCALADGKPPSWNHS
jgi:phosphonopyruvate decarboxylase